MTGIGVMQLTDTLEVGGAERAAINIANLLPRGRYRSYLCTTRHGGALEGLVAPDVGRLRLARQKRFDHASLERLVTYIRQNDIRIIHAHKDAVFMAAAASFHAPHPRVLWHNHRGRLALKDHSGWYYRLISTRINGVITVNRPLADWTKRRLHVADNRIWYIPNFACETPSAEACAELPGEPGQRIACVANFRPEKGHLTLIGAMALVVQQAPRAHLLLVGTATDRKCYEVVRKAVAAQRLRGSVTVLRGRTDITGILRACDIGVLSSVSEGFPLALVEYGMAELPAVATRVGECAEVLDEGRAGLLVEPLANEALAEALVLLLKSPPLRANLAMRFHERVQAEYSASRTIERVCRVYESVLAERAVEGEAHL